jgi:hypothetical protein
VDVRNAGFKLAPVDTNLFPDGWNNLTPSMLPLAVQAAMAAIEKICPEARNLLIVPENQTQQHVLPEQPGATAPYLPDGGPERTHWLHQPGHQEKRHRPPARR